MKGAVKTQTPVLSQEDIEAMQRLRAEGKLYEETGTIGKFDVDLETFVLSPAFKKTIKPA